MRYFLKLNVMSMLYSLIIFVPVQFMGNVYRISRLTNWDISMVNSLFGMTIIIGMILGTILIYYLTKNWMKIRKANFWTIILWIPYFILFVYIITSLFPVTNGGDAPNPVTGLLVIGLLMIFPIYILIINFLSYDNSLHGQR